MERRLIMSLPGARAGRLRSIVKPIGRLLGRIAGELAVAVALVAGWLLVTLALSRIFRGDVVWPLSLGLLLFSAAGWRLFGAVALHGLYALSKDTNA